MFSRHTDTTKPTHMVQFDTRVEMMTAPVAVFPFIFYVKRDLQLLAASLFLQPPPRVKHTDS